MKNVSISFWQSLKPVSKVAVWWKHFDLFVRRTSIEFPFVDLTQVMTVIKFLTRMCHITRGDSYHYLFFLFEVCMSKSPKIRMFSYFLVARLKVFESALKKIVFIIIIWRSINTKYKPKCFWYLDFWTYWFRNISFKNSL